MIIDVKKLLAGSKVSNMAKADVVEAAGGLIAAFFCDLADEIRSIDMPEKAELEKDNKPDIQEKATIVQKEEKENNKEKASAKDIEKPESGEGNEKGVVSEIDDAFLDKFLKDDPVVFVLTELREKKKVSKAVAIAAATFPANMYLTTIALLNRVKKLGFISIKLAQVQQTVCINKRPTRITREGEKRKVVPIMEGIKLKSVDTSVLEKVIDVGGTLAETKSHMLKQASRLNNEGRKEVVEMIKKLNKGVSKEILRTLMGN